MSSYLGLAVLCLVLTQAILEATFHLTRGLKDKFTNPQCVNNTGCSASQCAQYFARCETDSCEVCVCDEQSPTYVASEKRCVKDDKIVPQLVPEYSSFAISSTNGQPYLAASTISNKLEQQSKYTGSPNQLWLYTSSRKLLNLKTLECLDSENPSIVAKVALRPCTVNQTLTQMWYCNRSSDGLYGIYHGQKSYLDFSGGHFYMGDDEQLNKWVADKGTGALTRSICDVPDTYKGCYRFTDGSSVKRFIPKSQLRDSYEKMRISAPIFSDRKAGRSSCFLAWDESMFSVNDQPWTFFSAYENNFDHSGGTEQSGEVVFRFHEQAKTVWAGALMKLKVHCQDHNTLTRETTYENHCMLLKFDGVFNESLQEYRPSEHRTTVHPSKNRSKSSRSDSSYKSSTIGLSVVLGFVLLVMVVAAVTIYRRRSTRAWVTTNVDDDVSAKPFCDAEGHS